MSAPFSNSSARTPSQKWWREGLLALLLLAATALAYGPSLRGDFVWDDDTHISENRTLGEPDGLQDIWFTPGATCQYYPLTFTFFRIGYQLWGLNVLGFHLLTLLFHVAAALLLRQVLIRLKLPGATLAAWIFALHPVCVMSVAWMTELKNTLSATLALGAAWAYLRFARIGIYAELQPDSPPAPRSWRFYLLALGLFQLGLFAKTAISFLPVTLLLITWWQRPQIRWRDVLPLIPMLALAVGMGIATIVFERNLGGMEQRDFQLGWLDRILISGRSFWFYLGKLVAPHPLVFIYPRWDVNPAVWWQYLFPLGTVAFLTWLWIQHRRLGKGLFVAFMHFYITTSLLILFQVLYMMRYSFVSDHWQYFGCMSLIALAACAITRAIRQLQPGSARLARAACGLLVVALAFATWHQTHAYRDAETLWRRILADNPRCWMAHVNFGQLLERRGEMDQAAAHYATALRIDPNHSEILNNVGKILADRGQPEKAMEFYRRALAINPADANVLNNVGSLYLEQKQYADSAVWFRAALQANPTLADAHNNLGNALLFQGDLDAASASYLEAVRLQSDCVDAINSLGVIHAQKGNYAQAIRQFRRVIELAPDYSRAHNNLGTLLEQQDALAEAAQHFAQYVLAAPQNPTGHLNLARVKARLGDPTAATLHVREALRLKPDYPEALDLLRDLNSSPTR